MSAVGEETNKPETSSCLRWKLCYYFSASHLAPENFVSASAFCLSFIIFVFNLWQIEPLLQIFRVWVTRAPQKILTKSPK